MSPEKPVPSATLRAGPTRFIGLDVHKHYLIAIGVWGSPKKLYHLRLCLL